MWSYEDFYQNFDVKFEENFNFGFDVVDAYAAEKPDKLALLWCDDHGEERRFTFSDLSRLSNQAANLLRAMGIGKGDAVLMMLRRRYEYWFLIVALHKIGATAIPATHLLTEKDIVYRVNAANVKCVITIDDNNMVPEVDAAQSQCPSLAHKIVLQSSYPGWITLHKAMEGMSEAFPRPTGEEGTLASDPMLVYFTSGHHRPAQDGSAQLHLPSRAYHHRKVLAEPGRKLPPHHGGGYRVGQVQLGQGLWPMDRGSRPVRLRYG